uniref:Cation/H+ exchanger domain-containing protein n=1 Tax=Brassica oleracea var. oleracea TaxID=109376 RepID=A0A0D3BGQ5_BRAOL
MGSGKPYKSWMVELRRTVFGGDDQSPFLSPFELEEIVFGGAPRVPRYTSSQSRVWSNTAQALPARPASNSGLCLRTQSRPEASSHRPGPRAGSSFAISIGYQKRNIFSLKPNSDLRILTCVQKPGNISRAISFIQLFSSPNQEFPIIVTVLHLVKLVGQIVPILISHDKKSKQLINNSYIHTVNLAFSQLMQESFDSESVAMFTALSHEKLMHEDICMLALDQTTSMIVVPSGRTWTIHGEFMSDDVAIRRLNISLLERSPCSIGILVDRGQFMRKDKRKDYINVCAIFIGGKDDREALSLVNRMKHNPKVQVAVIRLMSNQETESTNWDYILDHEVIKELKDPESNKNIAYTERILTGGPEVATTVRLLSEEYDLMVVGRNHGMSSPDFSGLLEWMEFPELGVIGDLLAVRDLRSSVSVLIVQQRHQA